MYTYVEWIQFSLSLDMHGKVLGLDGVRHISHKDGGGAIEVRTWIVYEEEGGIKKKPLFPFAAPLLLDKRSSPRPTIGGEERESLDFEKPKPQARRRRERNPIVL